MNKKFQPLDVRYLKATRLIVAGSLLIAVFIHLLSMGVLWLLPPGFIQTYYRGGPVPVRNPFEFGPDAPRRDDDPHESAVWLMPRRVWPSFDYPSRRKPEFRTRDLEIRDALGRPKSIELKDLKREVTAVGGGLAYGDLLDFVSDKAFNGKGTYDQLGVEGGGGGRYGTPLPGLDPVHLALGWLARHQNKEGSWSEPGSLAHCNKTFGGDIVFKKGTCSPVWEDADLDAGLTGLCSAAFFGAGYTPNSRYVWDGIPFGEVQKNALQWILFQQKPDGSIGARDNPSFLLNHVLCTLALNEASRNVRTPPYREAARKATAFLVDVLPKEAPENGRLMGWAVMAMTSGSASGIDVPPGLAGAIERWRDDAVDPTLILEPESWGRHSADPHRRYFGTVPLLVFELSDGSLWRRLGPRILEVARQGQHRNREECRLGSWEPDDDGRIYRTALLTLTMELCPRYNYGFGESP